jgi:hypothetical protein
MEAMWNILLLTCDTGAQLGDRVRSVSINMLLIPFKHTCSVYNIYSYLVLISSIGGAKIVLYYIYLHL